MEARPSAKQLELDSDGETGDVGYSERPVPECGYHIQVVDREFVEKRDVAKKRFAFQIIGKPLPDIEKRAQSGGKPIIFRIRIPVGFPHPIVFARYEIEIDAARERFDGESVAAADAPRYVGLFEGVNRVRPVRLGFRQESDQNIGFPAAFAAVVPPCSE